MFSKCTDEEEVKRLFRKLAMRLHPDYGGCNELMSLLNDAYELALIFVKSKSSWEHKPKKETKQKTDKNFYETFYDDISEGDPKLKIIDEIYAYAEKNKSFKIDFTESVEDFLRENGYITSRQFNRLVYIYYAFAMDRKKNKENT